MGSRECGDCSEASISPCAIGVQQISRSGREKRNAAVSVLVIVVLLLARVFGWFWMGPLAGIVGVRYRKLVVAILLSGDGLVV
jgi:hypothetical protein